MKRRVAIEFFCGADNEEAHGGVEFESSPGLLCCVKRSFLTSVALKNGPMSFGDKSWEKIIS
jgi:hypothetical protein